MMHRRRTMLVLASGCALAILAAVGIGVRELDARQQTTEYCATCHAMRPYFESWATSNHHAHAHANAGITCLNCHTRSTRDGLRELWVTATGQKPTIQAHKASAQECLTCHGSHEVLASRTQDLLGPDAFPLGRNPHDSHWGPLDCGVCHNMHKPSVDFCANCHGAPRNAAAWLPSKQ